MRMDIEKVKEFMRLFSQDVDSQLYLVGGAVRDLVLGFEPVDFDFCTPLTPEEVKDNLMRMGVFKKDIDMKESRIGVVLVNYLGEQFEITTFRQETYAPGNRKPQVTFVKDLKLDLLRRDFTINAMAMDSKGEIHLPEGVTLTNLGTLKTVIPEATSFYQDPLRVLRGVRIGVKYKLEGVPRLINFCPNLVTVSLQSVRKEMEKGLKVQGTWRYYRFMMKDIVPYFNHAAHVVADFPYDSTPLEQWAFVAKHNIAHTHFTPEQNEALIQRSFRMMEFSKSEIEEILRRVQNG